MPMPMPMRVGVVAVVVLLQYYGGVGWAVLCRAVLVFRNATRGKRRTKLIACVHAKWLHARTHARSRTLSVVQVKGDATPASQPANQPASQPKQSRKKDMEKKKTSTSPRFP